MKTQVSSYYSKSLGKLSPGVSRLLYALIIALFALAMVTRSAAQDIYMSSYESTYHTITIGKYAPDGTPINPTFITEPTSYLQSMSIYEGALVVPNATDDPSNAAVLEYGLNSGTLLNPSIKVPYPVSAVVGGKHMFVLYDYPVRLGEYVYNGLTLENADLLPEAKVFEASQLAAWTDSLGNTDLYISMTADDTGRAHSGYILHVVVDSNGLVVGNPTTIAPGLNYPTGIAVSPDGQYVYVVDYVTTVQDDNGHISKYTKGGAFGYQVPAQTQSPYGIATSGAALFVTGYGNGSLNEYYAATGAVLNFGLVQGMPLPTSIAVGPPSCIAPPANLAAWYTFDQTGASQNDLAGQNTATAFNTTSIPGEVAEALQFDGTSTYVEAPSTSQNNLGTSDFSLDAWVKVANTVDEREVRVIIDKRDATYRGYHFFLYNGKVGLQLFDSHGFNNYIASTAMPADNQWHLVAVTVVRNGTTNTGGTWYLDGAPIGNFDPRAQAGSLNNSEPLDIGKRSTALHGGSNFKGGIDEVEIFTRALSASEIFSIMQAGPAGKCKCMAPPSNMVAWYGFDQAGSTQNDLSTTNNPATAYHTTSVIGEVAGALQFNGATSYVEAPTTSALDLGTSDFSIDAWVRLASIDDDVKVVMDKRDANYHGYHFYLYRNTIGVQLDDGDYQNYGTNLNVAVPADNRWHLIAVTVVRNLPTGGTFYLDGVVIGSFDPTAHQGSLSSTVPLDIGVRSIDQGGEGYFKGGIDELEIFNRALGSDEILGLMQAGHAGKCKK